MPQSPALWALALSTVSYSISGTSLADPKPASHPVKVPDYVRRARGILKQQGHFLSWPCAITGGQRELDDPELWVWGLERSPVILVSGNFQGLLCSCGNDLSLKEDRIEPNPLSLFSFMVFVFVVEMDDRHIKQI